MSLLISPSKFKFLFDENVDKRLERFLKQQGFDIVSKPKGLANGKLADFSKSEKLVLVTNDEDFIGFNKERIFSVVWLRIPQREIGSLIESFSKLVKEAKPEDFKGNLITLNESGFKISPLSSKSLAA